MMSEQIRISEVPEEIDTIGLEISQSQCILNSYQVAQKNPGTDIVEGLIIIFDTVERATAMPHMWNKLGDIYFDVTKEKVWSGKKESEEIKEVMYFCIKIHSSIDISNGDVLEFCSDTHENVAAANKKINRGTK